jgi:hypothetical protein
MLRSRGNVPVGQGPLEDGLDTRPNKAHQPLCSLRDSGVCVARLKPLSQSKCRRCVSTVGRFGSAIPTTQLTHAAENTQLNS